MPEKFYLHNPSLPENNEFILLRDALIYINEK